MKAFSFTDAEGTIQIGCESGGHLYNFSQAWEIYKQVKNRGRGPSLNFLQIMVEADFFHLETFEQVFAELKAIRSLDDLTLPRHVSYKPPVGRPQKIIGVGRNYRAHAEEMQNPVPEAPIFFSKSPSALIGHAETIRKPREVGRVDHEGEVAVVIGKAGSRIPAGRALDYVAGYTLLNDVTARELQRADIKAGRPWFRSKSFDTFCPVGPYLVPRQAVPNPEQLVLEVRVNGARRQSARLSDMIFPISELMAYISKHMTLQPGDLIATGTPEGVGPLEAGDVVEVEVPELGVLKNRVEIV